MSKSVRTRGLTPLSSILREYEVGQRVNIVIDPGFHKGMPHHRYQGRSGVICAKRGRAVVVDVPVGKAVRTIIVRPEHLRPSRG